jgi:hypothetical protein
MSTFVKGGSTGTPFGRNEYLRSTKGRKTQSYTVAASTVQAQTIDGVSGQKILQPGMVMAKITSGVDSGKIGPYSTDTVGVTDGRSTITNIVGINNTFLPWQLMERDVEVAVDYEASVVQGWCLEYTAAGAAVPQVLSNATRDVIKAGSANASTVGVSFLFK